jgi:hypothetical protein
MADVNLDGLDDVTGQPVIIPDDASTELPPVPVVGSDGSGKSYYKVVKRYAGNQLVTQIVPVTTAEALGLFFNQTPEKIKVVQNQFIKAGYKNIKATGKLDTQQQVDNYRKAVLDAWDAYSTLVSANPDGAPDDIAKFVDNSAVQGGKGGGSSVYETLYLTSKPEALQYFNQLYTDLTGQVADPKKAEEFYSKLNAAEKANVQTQTTTTAGGKTRTVVTKAGVDEADKEQVALDIVGRDVTIESLAGVGGQLGTNLKQVDTLLSDYNVTVDPKTRLEYLLNTTKSKTGLQDTALKIKKLSALQNPALAPFIEADYKPSEVFGGLKTFKEQYYGQPSLSPNPWDDEDLRWAAKQQKLPSYDEWQSYLGNKPGAEFTPGFRQKSATFSSQVLAELGMQK